MLIKAWQAVAPGRDIATEIEARREAARREQEAIDAACVEGMDCWPAKGRGAVRGESGDLDDLIPF